MESITNRNHFKFEKEDLPDVAKKLIESAEIPGIWKFFGEMGSGKTTLIKEICKQLDIEDQASSPTFSIVNEYFSPSRNLKVYHFDCYRLETLQEAFEIDLEDYFYQNALCLVEWPQLIESLIPKTDLTVYLDVESNFSRNIELEYETE